MPATYSPIASANGDMIPVIPFQVPQTHPVISNGVPQFYAPTSNPFINPTMHTQPPTTAAVHPASHHRVNGGIDPELDKILWDAMDMDTSHSGVNSVQCSNGVPINGGYPVNPQPPVTGNTITCKASASVFHPDFLPNGHPNPPPGGNEVQDILQQFL